MFFGHGALENETPKANPLSEIDGNLPCPTTYPIPDILTPSSCYVCWVDEWALGGNVEVLVRRASSISNTRQRGGLYNPPLTRPIDNPLEVGFPQAGGTAVRFARDRVEKSRNLAASWRIARISSRLGLRLETPFA